MWDFTFPEKETKPRYLFIADSLEADIVSEELPPGYRLMPHRKFAAKIGVTVTTITKAYAEAQRRGLISTHVGRGTFVLERGLPASEVKRIQENAIIELGAAMPLSGTVPSVKPILQRILQEDEADALVNHFTPMGLYKHREIGAEWLRRNGIDATAESVVVANGQQHALSSIVSGLFKHGDRAAVSQFTNPGFQMLMQRNGVTLEGVKMDDDGMLPEYLDKICRAQKICGLFITENMQNPNAKSTSDKRRQELCEVIAKHNLPVLEDGTFYWLNAGKPKTFASLLPDLSVYYAGLGAPLYSGLRVSFIHAPEKFHTRICQAIVENIWTISPLGVAIACEAIADGTLVKSIKTKRAEMARRLRIVQDALAGFSVAYSGASNYAWLFLPDSWQSKEFERQAEKNGVRVFSADRFIVGSFTPPNCVRLSLTGPKDSLTLKRGLNVLRGLLKKEGELITPIW